MLQLAIIAYLINNVHHAGLPQKLVQEETVAKVYGNTFTFLNAWKHKVFRNLAEHVVAPYRFDIAADAYWSPSPE